MSGRRSSNPRWLTRGIVLAICSLASVGVGLLAPAYSTAASSTISAAKVSRLASTVSPSTDQPRNDKAQRRGPQFVVQPRLVGRNLFFVVSVHLYRTVGQHRSAMTDLLRGSVDVSHRYLAIRTVGLDPKTRAKKLIFSTQLQRRFLRSTNQIQYRIRLPLAVARSLAATSIRYRRARVRVVLVHAKDTDQRLAVHQTLELAGSDIRPLPRAHSQAATKQLSGAGTNRPDLAVYASVTNNTPFNLQVTVQGTQCVYNTQWNGILWPGQVVVDTDAYVTRSGPTGSLNSWVGLSKSAVTALQQPALNGGQNAIKHNANDFSSPGAINNGVSFAADFISDFIDDKSLTSSCSDTPATWVTSGVAVELPLPVWQGFFPKQTPGAWAINSYGDTDSSGPQQTKEQLASSLGALSSVQWNFDDGNAGSETPGASYFSSGLLQTTELNDESPGSREMSTVFYYQNNANHSYGPSQSSKGTMTATMGVNPANGTPAVNLICNTSSWSLVSPWSSFSSYSYDLSSPPNYSPTASSSLVTSFYYNLINGSGDFVIGLPIPGVNSIVSGYADNSQPQVWVDQSTIENIFQNNNGQYLSSWGCSVQAQSQVPSFQQPQGWPSNNSTLNLGWYSPPINVTVPNPLNP